MLLTRPFARPVTPGAVAVFNIGQAVPSIGLLVLLAIGWGIGFWPDRGRTGRVLGAAGAAQHDGRAQPGGRAVIESGRGMGMSSSQVLTRIELPLAVPVILAGLRTALVINVGTATLAAFINAGGLGS